EFRRVLFRSHHHPHTEQKKRNKQGAPHKFDAVHQRGSVRDQAVQGKSGHERADNRFHTGQFRQKSRQKYHGHHENILGGFFPFYLFEEPPADDRETNKYNGDENNQRNDQLNPELGIQGAFGRARNNDQDQQDQGIGHNRAPNGNGDRLVLGQSEPAHDRDRKSTR